MAMATEVLIAHTGQRLQVDTTHLSSLDDFKAAVSRQSLIPAHCIISLTPQGRSLRIQTIQSEKEIYVYDTRLAQPTSPGTTPPPTSEIPVPKRYSISNPPNSIDDTRSLQSWQELFKTRWLWAAKVVEDCSQMAAATQERYSEMDVMLRCLDAAVANLESVVKGLEPKYAEIKKWLPAAQVDYGALASGWEQYLSLARSVPISPAMVRFMTEREIGGAKGRPPRQATLEDLVDLETARRAGRLAPASLRKFNGWVADLDKAAGRLFKDSNDLLHEFEKTVARSALLHAGESQQLLQDIEAVAKKVDTDYQTTLEYPDKNRDVLQASKIAANHTERLLPSLRNRALEMDDMLRVATEARNSLAAETVEFMRSITDVTALSHSVKSQISAINQGEDLATFDYLRLIQQVPYMYASFLVEAVKRREWLEKVRQDSSTLANEMALFQEEEVKRRRKWHKAVGNAYGPPDPMPERSVPGLEVNLVSLEDQWPPVARKDVEEFLALLQTHKADPDIISDIAKLVAELDAPTRQQSKRIKAFKNGSVHEAALGRSGLLMRGDDDLLRSLQDDKSKLESKLKTAESRVRRLEDLLHRQTQASRPSIGTLFQIPSQQLSDRNDSTFSIKSTRTSDDRRRSVEGTDVLLGRIQQLEAELNAEKERSAALEKDLGGRATLHDDIKGQIEEANSTKKDLLENLEALKREFMTERKSLEDEIKRLQARLEDTEDEIEHFGESRENEKASYDDKISALEAKLEQMAEEKREEAQISQRQVEHLHNEARLQRETMEAQERKLQASQDQSKALQEQLEKLDREAESRLRTLQSLWQQLSPDEAPPEETIDFVDAVLGKAADVVAKAQGLEADLSLLRLELDESHNAAKLLRSELAATKEQLSGEETTSIHLREALAEEKAKVAALEEELASGREQLSQLRVQIADGETGSESLRTKLQEEEARITLLTEELAAKRSQVGSLEEETRHYKEKMYESEKKLSELTTWFKARTERTKDLTQRLYSQNERLTRLLERLGFSVTRQDNAMVVQKIPRSERSSQAATDADLGASLRRSDILGSRSALDSPDSELLYWVNCPDPKAEAERYDAYMACLGSFDTEAFCEALYRRFRDIEHLARKLQRDARTYREKAHALQKEAHDKIAFKHFKEGDLALFLPTRNQTSGAWAAFNIGFPHYFLREQESHRLHSGRDWLLARISRIQERIVDLSKSLQHQPRPAAKATAAESESLNDEDNDNPFDLSDGLRWYLIDAAEYKPGAPSTPGPAKSTVAANNVEAMADMHTHGRLGAQGGGPAGRGGASGIEGVSKTLSKSLESRRSSTGSKKALPFAIGASRGRDSAAASETNSLRAAPTDSPAVASPAQQHAALHGASPPAAASAPVPAAVPEAHPRGMGQREQSTVSVSPSKKSVVWDSFWSLDVG